MISNNDAPVSFMISKDDAAVSLMISNNGAAVSLMISNNDASVVQSADYVTTHTKLSALKRNK
jgi:hypothetical protein